MAFATYFATRPAFIAICAVCWVRLQAQRIQAEPFRLADVRLLPPKQGAVGDEMHLYEAQALNVQYLNYLEPDRLLYTFRAIAGLDPRGPHGTAEPYGGWISPTNPRFELVNGHFTGHYMSALAFTAASTGDPNVLAKSEYLVKELAACQDNICRVNASMCGYLSAYHLWQIERVENHTQPTWATYYTIHKIMAGLLDLHENTANDLALTIAKRMAVYFKNRIDTVVRTKGWGWWKGCLLVEFGGMNEVAYNLFAITGDPMYKDLGDYFYKSEFMEPLAQSIDSLDRQHANTHLPQIVGIARRWELFGNATQNYITRFFYQTLSQKYTYSATGGSNIGEAWQFPGELGRAIETKFDEHGHAVSSNGFSTEESCTQYNALKIVRHLFSWSPTAELGDDYEHKLLNGVLGIQKRGEIGRMLYMNPLGRGVTRANGWGSPNSSFWCCYGTGVESFGKLGDSIYFHNDSTREIWVSQFASSNVSWAAAGMTLTQRAVYTEEGRTLQISLTLGRLQVDKVGSASSRSTIHIRIPAWAAQDKSTVTLNNEIVVAAGDISTGSFLGMTRAFFVGDVIRVSLGLRPRLAPINDGRPEYANVCAIMYGPLLLAGLSAGSFALRADAALIDNWFRIVGPMRFEAKGADKTGFTLIPFNRIVDERYTVYFNVSLSATDGNESYPPLYPSGYDLPTSDVAGAAQLQTWI